MASVINQALQVARKLTPGKEPSLKEQLAELSKRVIRGDKALICCRAQENRVVNETMQIVGTVFNMLAGLAHNQALVMAPMGLAIGTVTEGVEVGVSRIFVTGARAIPVGAVVILAGSTVSNWQTQLWASETAAALATAVGTITRANRKNCYECLKSKTLSQSKPRSYETAKVRRRVG